MKNLELRKKYKIEIKMKSPDITVIQDFCLADYETAKDWIKAAQDWISNKEK